MKTYLGVKTVQATPMTRGDYNTYRGWTIPKDENPADEGYLVKYSGSDAYESWVSKVAFELANRRIDGMTFGHAIEAMRSGEKVARRGWNGKDMFTVMMPPLSLPAHNSMEPGAKVNDRTSNHIGEDALLEVLPYFAMFTAQGEWLPGWLASQTDMLAEDWMIV